MRSAVYRDRSLRVHLFDQDQAASKSPVTPYSSLSNAELKYVSQSMYGGETEVEIVNIIWFYFSVSLRTVRD